MRMYNNYLEELDVESQAIYKYYITGEAEKLESSIIVVVETSVYLPYRLSSYSKNKYKQFFKHSYRSSNWRNVRCYGCINSGVLVQRG